VPWLHWQKNCWHRVLGSVVIQLYAGECTPSVDRALIVLFLQLLFRSFQWAEQVAHFQKYELQFSTLNSVKAAVNPS